MCVKSVKYLYILRGSGIKLSCNYYYYLIAQQQGNFNHYYTLSTVLYILIVSVLCPAAVLKVHYCMCLHIFKPPPQLNSPWARHLTHWGSNKGIFFYLFVYIFFLSYHFREYLYYIVYCLCSWARVWWMFSCTYLVYCHQQLHQTGQNPGTGQLFREDGKRHEANTLQKPKKILSMLYNTM